MIQDSYISQQKFKYRTAGLVLTVIAAFFIPEVSRAAVLSHEAGRIKEQELQYQNLADDGLSDKAGLSDFIRYGLLHNSSVKSAFYRWKASVSRIDQVTALDDPNTSFRIFIDEVETRVGPQKEIYGISQRIPLPGKLQARGEAASAVSRQKFADYEKTKLQYLYELKDAYFEYWYLYKNILVTEKNMELLRHLEGVAQSRYKSNIGSNQDLLKAQLELGKLENELLTLNDYKTPVIARLNAVLNRPIEDMISPPAELDHRIEVLNEQGIIESFYQNNTDLKKAQFRIEESKKRVQLARLDYLPDFTIGYDYIRVADRPLVMADNGKDASSVMVSMNVPLWLQKQNARLSEAQSDQITSEAESILIEKYLLAKIKMTIFKLKDAQRQIQLYRDALVPKAEQSLKASETAYASGSVEFLSLIDSERSLLNFQLAYYRSIRDYEQRFAELEMIVGQPLRGNHNE